MTGPNRLSAEISRRTDQPTDQRIGEVVGVGAYSVDVRVGAGVVAAAYVDSYSPAVGDSVVLLVQGDAWVITGRIVGNGLVQSEKTPSTGPSILAGHYISNPTGGVLVQTATEALVPRYSLEFFHPLNHSVLVKAKFQTNAQVNDAWIIVRLREASLTGTLVGDHRIRPRNPAAVLTTEDVSFSIPPSFGGVVRTYVLTAAKLQGSGDIFIEYALNSGSYMMALDAGDTATFPARTS